MDKTSLGDRMKQYEAVPKNFLMRKNPVIIRLDGKAFHTFTRGFEKPFDKIIEIAMKETMLYLCKNIQGCVLGYTQSDEITLVLCDYQKIDTDAWFEYNVQKMVSISAAMATYAFNMILDNIAADSFAEAGNQKTKTTDLIMRKRNKGAFFDARAFSLPRNEVVNCLIWRQQDATRNSIQALAQSLYSHNELQGINCNKLQDKMFTEKGVNWNDLTTYQKRGACAIQKLVTKASQTKGIVTRYSWVVDDEIPIFTQDRSYIEDRITFYTLKEDDND
jgi:tRNA(His) 5'-end guanylyltransferase